MYEDIISRYGLGLAPGDLPDETLKLTWTGTAGFIVEFSGATLLIDPFVTRPGALSMLLFRQAVNESLCRLIFPKADAILMGHTHYDHMLDVPVIAKNTGAAVYGSDSAAAVCRGAGLEERAIRTIDPWKEYKIGPFEVTFIPSDHGKILFGRVPFAGDIKGAPAPPMRASAFKSGGTYGIRVRAGDYTFCHFGSANLVDEEVARAGGADALLLGVSGRQRTPDFLRRMTSAFRPSLIIAHHYDNFFKPLMKGLSAFRGVSLDEFEAEYKAVCPDVRLVFPHAMRLIAIHTGTHAILNPRAERDLL